MALFFYCF